LSLGGTSPSSALDTAIEFAHARDVVVVAAAGNLGDMGSPPSYPAANELTLAVVRRLARTRTSPRMIVRNLCFLSSPEPRVVRSAARRSRRRRSRPFARPRPTSRRSASASRPPATPNCDAARRIADSPSARASRGSPATADCAANPVRQVAVRAHVGMRYP
jgi:hypothetical protein